MQCCWTSVSTLLSLPRKIFFSFPTVFLDFMRYRLLVGYQTALKATVSVSAMVWIINILQRFMCSQHYTKGLSNWGVEASRRKSGLWVTLKGIWIPSFLFDSWPPWRKQTVVTTDSHLGILPCQSPPLNKPSKP